jgi:hypothetical protein
MAKLGAFFAVLLLGTLGFFLWWNRLPPFHGHGDPVDVALAALSADQDEVRVEGTAHYPVRLSRTWPAHHFKPERTLWFFPLFEPKDTQSRSIAVMVASDTAPEALVSYEDLVVEGYARPPAARMDNQSQEAFLNLGYTFAPDYVLVETFPPSP